MKEYRKKWKEFLEHGKPERKEGQPEKDYRVALLVKAAQAAAFAVAALALLRGVFLVLPQEVTVSTSVNGRELPIYSVETPTKQIALTFDASWGNKDTRRILDILKKNEISATFFLTGIWVEQFPEDVKTILAEGHDLGNHSENHKNMSQLSSEECLEELQKVHTKVQELTGYDMFLFRPPYGDYDNQVIKNAAKLGYYTIQWDVDTSESELGGSGF